MKSIQSTLVVALVLGNSLMLPALSAAQAKHHKAKAMAAGVAAYEIAKHTGRPGHKNFAQRHPVLTGIAAAAVVNHHLKHKKH
jgi:hypothetical protein